MEKLKAAKSMVQKKVGDFGAKFGEQKRVTIKMLNGDQIKIQIQIKTLRSENRATYK